ncbi:uncharacterized protein METZ01_LOCUS283221, partial [marine metagenome]
ANILFLINRYDQILLDDAREKNSRTF